MGTQTISKGIRIASWVGIVIYAIAAIMLFVDGSWQYPHIAYATEENADLFFYIKHDTLDFYHKGVVVVLLTYLASIVGLFALLKQMKWGFWVFVIANLVLAILMIIFAFLGGMPTLTTITLCWAIIAPIVLFLVSNKYLHQ